VGVTAGGNLALFVYCPDAMLATVLRRVRTILVNDARVIVRGRHGPVRADARGAA
jgi:hypothetical protein